MTLGFTKEYLDVGRVSNSAEGHIHLTISGDWLVGGQQVASLFISINIIVIVVVVLSDDM